MRPVCRSVPAAWGPPGVMEWGAGVLCRGLSLGLAAGPTWVPVLWTARPCLQTCPEDGSISWAGDCGTPGQCSPGEGLLCQHSMGGTPWRSLTPLLCPPHEPPSHSSHHSLLSLPSREIINGVTVTDKDNNELGCSRVSLRMGIQVRARCGGDSSTGLACRGQR